jgi:hypothetical protein
MDRFGREPLRSLTASHKLKDWKRSSINQVPTMLNSAMSHAIGRRKSPTELSSCTMQLVLGDTRMPNNIIHPTLAEVLGTGYRCFGRVMMSVKTIMAFG